MRNLAVSDAHIDDAKSMRIHGYGALFSERIALALRGDRGTRSLFKNRAWEFFRI